MEATAAVRLARPDANEIDKTEWGRLVWMVSRALGNSEEMTVGKCFIDPGQANPRHYHPNCDEVLHVLSGTILHTLGDEEFEMSEGDTISIPRNTLHNAANIGDDEAVLMISFSSADRQVVGE